MWVTFDVINRDVVVGIEYYYNRMLFLWWIENQSENNKRYRFKMIPLSEWIFNHENALKYLQNWLGFKVVNA